MPVDRSFYREQMRSLRQLLKLHGWSSRRGLSWRALSTEAVCVVGFTAHVETDWFGLYGWPRLLQQQLRRLEAELLDLARKDPLTGNGLGMPLTFYIGCEGEPLTVARDEEPESVIRDIATVLEDYVLPWMEERVPIDRYLEQLWEWHETPVAATHIPLCLYRLGQWDESREFLRLAVERGCTGLWLPADYALFARNLHDLMAADEARQANGSGPSTRT